tara:strand:- start:125 stop:388 length:264 start_codon:yes stop_codon:yes gene_type:complete
MKYISIYEAVREHGGDEEGGWSYWVRHKIHDIKVGLNTEAKVERAMARLRPILIKNSGQWSWESKLQAHVFEGEHGPEDYSESSHWE